MGTSSVTGAGSAAGTGAGAGVGTASALSGIESRSRAGFLGAASFAGVLEITFSKL